MTKYDEYKIQNEQDSVFPAISTYRAKLVSTTNNTFKYYEGLNGVLMILSIGFSPIFQPDNIRYEELTMSWLVEADGLTLKTKNSIYVFEELEN